MCGIIGLVDLKGNPGLNSLPQIQRGLHLLESRGPDRSSSWNQGPCILGHRRLSIIDLSDSATQPMLSRDGRYAIVFNGEIYNYQELQNELRRDHQLHFGSRSDTEVLLNGFITWGLPKLLNKVRGMFAFGIWDNLTSSLILARDPIGKKPLVYSMSNSRFSFSSTVSSILETLEGSPSVNLQGVQDYFRHLSIPGSQTIFLEIRKLPPGHFLELKSSKGIYECHVKQYWQLPQGQSLDKQPARSIDEYLSEFEILLQQSVDRRLVADVPLGLFLSGGIDSSLVARYASNRVKGINAFSIGFQEPKFDESKAASVIAKAFGLNHHIRYLTHEDFLKASEKIVEVFDEPFGDVSAIPTMLLSSFARERVTVALSGDGGDELFGGYNYYRWIDQIIKYWSAGHFFSKLFPSSHLPFVPYQGRLLARAFSQNSPFHAFSYMRSSTKEFNISDLFVDSSGYQVSQDEKGFNQWDSTEYGRYDFTNTLVNDYLVKVDRASMAASLEVRSPFLDLDLTHWINSVPKQFKFNHSNSKILSRLLLSRFLPKEIVNLPKKGFEVPIRNWFRNELAYETRKLSSNHNWEKFGIRSKTVSKLVHEHLDGKMNHETAIWCLMILSKWFQKMRVIA